MASTIVAHPLVDLSAALAGFPPPLAHGVACDGSILAVACESK